MKLIRSFAIDGGFDYPLKCDSVKSGEGLVARCGWKRAAFSPTKYIVEIIVRGRRIHFGIIQCRETAVD